MPLIDTAVRNAKPGEKARKLYDERGLYVEISPKGGRWWRLRYRIDGRAKTISLGTYPDVPLRLARERRDEARALIARGIDPSAQRKAEKAAKRGDAANTFEAVAREWISRQRWDPRHVERVVRRLAKNAFPIIGGRPVGEIEPICYATSSILLAKSRPEVAGGSGLPSASYSSIASSTI